MFDHRHEAFDRFVDRRVDVLAVERLGGGSEYRDLGHAYFACPQISLLVRNQYRVAHPWHLADAAEYFVRIGQLWHPLRADETGRLDGGQAGRGETIDQCDLYVRRQQRFLILQAIAGTDFNDADVVGSTHFVLQMFLSPIG